MKVIRFFLCLLVCFSVLQAKAQVKDTFEKGFIVTNEGERIDGFIKSNDLAHLSATICFRATEMDKDCKLFDTTGIKSFGTVTGKHFDRLTIEINRNSEEITVFAKLIVQGETLLYKTEYKSTTLYIVVAKGKKYVLRNDEIIYGDPVMKRYNYAGVLNLATEGFSTGSGQKISFNENDFIKVVSGYNASKGYESTRIKSEEKNLHYTLVNAGGGFKTNKSEYFLQAMHRIYNPNLNRSTSLNVGLNYYYSRFTGTSNNYSSALRGSLLSVPIQLQQNIFNKNVRPYVFLGLCLSYINIVDDKNKSLIVNGFQHNYGVGLLYGVGIEADIYKRFMLKTEFRHEVVNHLILFGIGYNFSK